MLGTKVYSLVEKDPVARFYYQGTRHSHPVRRTVAIIEETKKRFTGYELREGSIVRINGEPKIKTFRKDRIAHWGDYCRLRAVAVNRKKDLGRTTLERFPLQSILTDGI